MSASAGKPLVWNLTLSRLDFNPDLRTDGRRVFPYKLLPGGQCNEYSKRHPVCRYRLTKKDNIG